MTNKTARYSEEFKAEAVKSIAEHNGNISVTAGKLDNTDANPNQLAG